MAQFCNAGQRADVLSILLNRDHELFNRGTQVQDIAVRELQIHCQRFQPLVNAHGPIVAIS